MFNDDTPFLVCMALALFVIGMSCGAGCGRDYEREKAIEKNVGRWIINNKTGDTEFVYGVENEKP